MNQYLLPAGRSIGLKLIVVCGLVLLMAIPLLFISKTSFERAGRANEVAQEVASRYGHEQIVTGPVLVAPYIETGADGMAIRSGEYVVFAETGELKSRDFKTTLVKRSLFKIPTYRTDLTISAHFDLSLVKRELPERIDIDWTQARILVGVSDAGGLRDDITAQISIGAPLKFQPARFGVRAQFRGQKSEDFIHNTTIFAQRGIGRYMEIHPDIKGQDSFRVETHINLNGTKTLGFTAFASTTKVKLQADWPHPGFGGRFAPVGREIGPDGFQVSWAVPFLARDIPAHGKTASLDFHQFNQSNMTVSLINPVDPYQKINRALKYAVMFVGLVFLTYFLFETLVGVRVHAAQYVLIGLAQSIFYLLLLAFSEHIGFSAAFFIAAVATIGLSALYAGAVFGARKYALQAGLVFALVYGLLYTLMKLQDFALMVGALACFIAIAGTMYFTRNVDWYGGAKSNS